MGFKNGIEGSVNKMKLECRNLSKYYSKKAALSDFSLTFEPGIYGILGENGAGKSTLMNLITDNSKSDEGKIFWNEKEIQKQKKSYHEQLGYMPQRQGYYPEFSAIAYLIYMGKLKGLSRKQAKQQGMELLERLNLAEHANKRMADLSGGMRQRVMLAQALMGNPHILILDEPTVGLDPKERIRIRNFLAEISSERIILLATHVVSDVECIADQVLLMKEGKLLQVAPPSELIRQMEGHVAEKECTKKDLLYLSEQYNTANVVQRKEGLVIRVVGDQFEEGYHCVSDNLSLEDVYLYYCTNAW